MNAIAGVAVALKKALEPAFRSYGQAVLDNAQELAQALLERGAELITGGTSNHMLVLDTVVRFGADGRLAERVLDGVGITTNKQVIPDDPRPPLRPSGVRLGTPAATSRGMGRGEMRRIAQWVVDALEQRENEAAGAAIRSEVEDFCRAFPVPGF